MSERLKKRRHTPRTEPLHYAVMAEKGLADAEHERGRAFLSAAAAGWTMREIAEATGLSASTVCRIINRAERPSDPLAPSPLEQAAEPADRQEDE